MLVCSLDCLPSLQLRSAWSRPSQTHSLSHTRFSEVGVVDSESDSQNISALFFNLNIYLILGSYFYQRASTFPRRSTLQNFGQHLFARKMPPRWQHSGSGRRVFGFRCSFGPRTPNPTNRIVVVLQFQYGSHQVLQNPFIGLSCPVSQSIEGDRMSRTGSLAARKSRDGSDKKCKTQLRNSNILKPENPKLKWRIYV